MVADDIEKIICYLYRDRLLGCISNYAYTKSQISSGDTQTAQEVGQKWLILEEHAML